MNTSLPKDRHTDERVDLTPRIRPPSAHFLITKAITPPPWRSRIR